jgi:hypothetical protein
MGTKTNSLHELIYAQLFMLRASSVVEAMSKRRGKNGGVSEEERQFKSTKKIVDLKATKEEKYAQFAHLADAQKVEYDKLVAKYFSDARPTFMLPAEITRRVKYLEETIAKINRAQHRAIEKIDDEIQILEQKHMAKKNGDDDFDLSVGAKTHCKKWLNGVLYDRKIEISVRQTRKGNLCEQQGIDYLKEHIYKNVFVMDKNEETRNDGAKIGTCDLHIENFDGRGSAIIDDVKNAYTHEDMPLHDDDLPKSRYWWQALTYCILWKTNYAAISYVLMNMPPEILTELVRQKYGYKYTEAQYEELKAIYTYDELPPFLRIKRFEFKFTDAEIEKYSLEIDEKVAEMRRYIHFLISKLDAHKYKIESY